MSGEFAQVVAHNQLVEDDFGLIFDRCILPSKPKVAETHRYQ